MRPYLAAASTADVSARRAGRSIRAATRGDHAAVQVILRLGPKGITERPLDGGTLTLRRARAPASGPAAAS